MTKPRPCSHARRALVEFEAVKVLLGDDGQVVAWGNTPEMTQWAVAEAWRCAKCGDRLWRFARKGFGELSARAALQRYGVKPAALPPPGNYKPKPAVAVPLTAWPFPVSAHAESVAERTTPPSTEDVHRRPRRRRTADVVGLPQTA